MCLDPMTMIGAALSAAGTIANVSAQQGYVDEVNNQNNKAYELSRDARLAEQTRQKAYQQQSMDGWNKALSQTDPKAQEAAQNTAADQFMQTFDQQTPAIANGLLPGQAQASDEVSKSIATRMAQTAADTRKRVAALSKLTGYGAADASNKLALTDNADFLTTINGLRRGSLGVSNQEQSISPATVNKPSTLAGDLLSGFGSMALYGGGKNSVVA